MIAESSDGLPVSGTGWTKSPVAAMTGNTRLDVSWEIRRQIPQSSSAGKLLSAGPWFSWLWPEQQHLVSATFSGSVFAVAGKWKWTAPTSPLNSRLAVKPSENHLLPENCKAKTARLKWGLRTAAGNDKQLWSNTHTEYFIQVLA